MHNRNISHCKIHLHNFQALPDHVYHTMLGCVQKLDLAGNKFEEHGALRQTGKGGKLGMSFLHILLHRECALTELQLRGCELGDGPTRALAMALGESSASLRTLALADNRLGDAAAGAIRHTLSPYIYNIHLQAYV